MPDLTFQSHDLSIKLCRSFRSRLLGWMFGGPKGEGDCLWFPLQAKDRLQAGVHTAFVRGPIRLWWLDEAHQVLESRVVKPFRIALPSQGAAHVVETAAQFDNAKQLSAALQTFTKAAHSL